MVGVWSACFGGTPRLRTYLGRRAHRQHYVRNINRMAAQSNSANLPPQGSNLISTPRSRAQIIWGALRAASAAAKAAAAGRSPAAAAAVARTRGPAAAQGAVADAAAAVVAAATGAAAILVAADPESPQPESPQPDQEPESPHPDPRVAQPDPVWAVVAARMTGVKERQKNHRREVQENTAAARRGRRNRLRKITLETVQKLQNVYFPARMKQSK